MIAEYRADTGSGRDEARDQEGAVRGVVRPGAERRALPVVRRRRHAAGRIPVHPARIRPQRGERTALFGGQRPHVVRVGGVPERPLPDAGRRRNGNFQHGPGLLALVQPGTRPPGGRVSTYGLRQRPPGGVQGLLGRRQGGIRQPCVPARLRRRWPDVARPAAREVRGRRGLRRQRLAQPRFPAEQPGASIQQQRDRGPGERRHPFSLVRRRHLLLQGPGSGCRRGVPVVPGNHAGPDRDARNLGPGSTALRPGSVPARRPERPAVIPRRERACSAYVEQRARDLCRQRIQHHLRGVAHPD